MIVIYFLCAAFIINFIFLIVFVKKVVYKKSDPDIDFKDVTYTERPFVDN